MQSACRSLPSKDAREKGPELPIKTWSELALLIEGTGSYSGLPVTQVFNNTGTSISINHHRHDSVPTYRSGGPWYLSKLDYEIGFVDLVKKNGAGTNILYKGWAGPRHFGDTPTLPTGLDDSTMDSMGATAMSRVLPTDPNAEILNALAELYRDGLPLKPGDSIRKDGLNRKSPGNEYLNYEFGIKPLYSDIKKFADSAKNSRELLERLMANSDKAIRRRYFFPATTTTTVSNSSDYGYPSQAQIRWYGSTVRRRTIERWFEGVFEYHIPKGDDTLSKLRRWEAQANHLYGTRLTPEVVWNASPWSWFADWFTNIGDVMKNISALGSDGLRMRYGFFMSSEVLETRTSAYSDPINGKVYTATYNTIRTVKQRRPANPYGFGATGLATTSRQKAIAAAIASTRGAKISK